MRPRKATAFHPRDLDAVREEAHRLVAIGELPDRAALMAERMLGPEAAELLLRTYDEAVGSSHAVMWRREHLARARHQ